MSLMSLNVFVSRKVQSFFEVVNILNNFCQLLVNSRQIQVKLSFFIEHKLNLRWIVIKEPFLGFGITSFHTKFCHFF